MDDQLLRIGDVIAKTGFSRSKLYADISAGRFPSPLKAGRVVVWSAADLALWRSSLPVALGRSIAPSAGAAL
ncbi:MAG: helix-turn-helix transcriptional regulator [Caulobacteraceae bacterium]